MAWSPACSHISEQYTKCILWEFLCFPEAVFISLFHRILRVILGVYPHTWIQYANMYSLTRNIFSWFRAFLKSEMKEGIKSSVLLFRFDAAQAYIKLWNIISKKMVVLIVVQDFYRIREYMRLERMSEIVKFKPSSRLPRASCPGPSGISAPVINHPRSKERFPCVQRCSGLRLAFQSP